MYSKLRIYRNFMFIISFFTVYSIKKYILYLIFEHQLEFHKFMRYCDKPSPWYNRFFLKNNQMVGLYIILIFFYYNCFNTYDILSIKWSSNEKEQFSRYTFIFIFLNDNRYHYCSISSCPNRISKQQLCRCLRF